LAARAVDAVGFLWHKPFRTHASDARRLLIVRLDQLGDIVQTFPVIDGLTASFPGAQVDFLTTPIGAELLRWRGFPGKVHVWNCRWLDPKRTPNLTFMQLRNQLAREKYDVALDLRGDVRLISLLKAARVKIVAGYGSTGGGFLLDVDPGWIPAAHAVDRNLKLMESVGGRAVTRIPSFPSATFPSRTRRVRLVIHPDAGTSAKRWPVSAFVELINRLLQDQSFDVTLVGLDSAIGNAITGLATGVVENLMGRTSLAQLMDTLRASDIMLSNDSGPAHLMAALGKPVWVLWSGTAPSAEWQPRGGQVRLFEHPVPCAPCGLARCVVLGHPCMTNISVDDVFRALMSWRQSYAAGI
jgi:ADP-heptose:LPS heptosyltransferase